MVFCSRNSTFRSSLVPSTSSGLDSVLGARRASRLSISKLWMHRAYWTPTTLRLTLYKSATMFGRWLSIALTASSSCVMKVRLGWYFLARGLTDYSLLDFAFYINKNGWRSRPGWIIHWEGTPTAFGMIVGLIVRKSFTEILHSHALSLRCRFRAHIHRGSARRDGLDGPSHPWYFHLLSFRRHSSICRLCCASTPAGSTLRFC